MIKPQQIRGARAMLGLTQAALAKAAGLSTTGLNNIERGEADAKTSTSDAIQHALEAAGIEFIPENGGGLGVRLKKQLPGENHLKPTGPATDAFDKMDAAIREHRSKGKT